MYVTRERHHQWESEQRSNEIAAEATKGGIPENSVSSDASGEKPEVATPGEVEPLVELLADIPERIPGDTDEEVDVERLDRGVERERVGPEIAEIPVEELGRAIAPLDDRRRLATAATTITTTTTSSSSFNSY